MSYACVNCSNTYGSASTEFQIAQSRNPCVSSLQPKDELVPFSFAYNETLTTNFMKVGVPSDFFTWYTDCAVTQCFLLDSDCSANYTGDSVIIDPETHEVSARSNTIEGYSSSICIKCQNYDLGMLNKVKIEFTQTPAPCSQSITLKDSLDSFSFAFNDTISNNTGQVGVPTDVFDLKDECSMTQCSLHDATDQDCEADYTADKIFYNSTSLNFYARSTTIGGYTGSVCIACQNSYASNKTVIQFTQTPNPCSESITPKADLELISFYFNHTVSLATHKIGIPTDYFDLKDNCSITQCELKGEDCESNYTAGKVSIDPNSVDFYSKSTFPNGYTSSACVSCSNKYASNHNTI